MALKNKLWLLVVLALVGCAAPHHAHGQFLGYVASQTVSPAQVFTNQAANVASSTFTSIGQSSHIFTYCNTGFAGTIRLEASPDGTFATPVPIASATYGQGITTDTGCHVLQAGGYFTTVRARIINYVAGSVNAWYTAVAAPVTFAPAALGSNGPTSPIACDKIASQSVAQNSTGTLLIGSLAGTQIYICELTISFTAATTAANITLIPSTDGACGALGSSIWIFTVLGTTPQILNFGGPLGAFTRTNAIQNLASPTVCVTAGPMTASALVVASYAQF